MCLTHLAQKLTFLLAVIPHPLVHRSITCRTGTVFRNVTFITTKYMTDIFVITLLVIRDEIFPVPILPVGNDFWKLVNLEFLILGRMGIIKRTLLKRNISTDKVN